MFSPGGFDATLEKWTTIGHYGKTKILEHLSSRFTCIIFDRRETGESGGRVERITWAHYVAQGKGLLDHLGIPAAHVMGGCMGCSPAVAFGVAHPGATRSLILFWPVGGARYRINGHMRFAQHLAFVEQNGLAAVVELVKRDGKPFGQDPRGGPWASVLKGEDAFAKSYAALDVNSYKLLVMAMGRTLIDRDTAPGAEPEDMLQLQIPALIVPGRDNAHAVSAARYFEECLPKSQYWDIAVSDLTEHNTPQRLLAFLESASV
jgi:pimeloyl-ACP methyl ester carboxylesterase